MITKTMDKTLLVVIGGLLGFSIITLYVIKLAFEEARIYLPVTVGVAVGVLVVIIGLVYALIK